MPDDDKPKAVDKEAPLKALPEDPGLEDEIRKISRKVNRIMKRVKAANEAVRAIIAPETETNTPEEKTNSASENHPEEPSQSE